MAQTMQYPRSVKLYPLGVLAALIATGCVIDTVPLPELSEAAASMRYLRAVRRLRGLLGESSSDD